MALKIHDYEIITVLEVIKLNRIYTLNIVCVCVCVCERDRERESWGWLKNCKSSPTLRNKIINHTL